MAAMREARDWHAGALPTRPPCKASAWPRS